MIIKAIPTRYKGYHFRSMSEARWAVFMDYMGIEWGYEVQGFETPWGPYLPDFCARGAYGLVWIEIKGETPTLVEQFKLGHVMQAEKWVEAPLYPPPADKHGLMVWGFYNNPQMAPCYAPTATEGAGMTEAAGAELSYEDRIGDPHPNTPWFDRPYGAWMDMLCTCGLAHRRSRPGKVQKALYAARSARFDRGQTPT